MKRILWMICLLVSCLPTPAEGDKSRVRTTSVVPTAAVSRPLGSPPNDAVRAFARSYDEEASLHFDRALEALDALPSPQKDGYLAELRRGWLLYQAARHGESIAAYARAATLEKASIEARVGALLPQLSLKRWADVEAGARDVLQRDPGNYLAGLRLAFAVFSAGRFTESEVLYRKLLAFYPSDPDVRSGLGWSLLRMGKKGDAQRAFLEALEAAPRSPLALDGLKIAEGG